ncbi:hypothetical protein [Serratia liquefaciens]|uniref:hypothetical protein n=1 Tax=Serratia liquefaciens TaxID=614 RepID=UPI00217911B9|nr:hypothetical protein [Serratia liquefaciens]CAI2040531.1 Uncharacterised protein [Serratia liquefaciens]
MSNENLSELSKPVAWAFKEHIWATGLCGYVWRDKLEDEAPDAECESIKDVNPRYSQEYVSALLAELEAKTKRIADMEHVVAAAKCDDELWDAMAHRLKTLEAKLATPVRLPNKHDDEFWFGSTFQVAKFDRAVERAISAAGFTVEGDE